MNPQQIFTEVLPNGLTLVVEAMPAVQSAAFTMLIPAGSIYDPVGENGAGAVLTDLLTRGAGDLDSRELSLTLDNLGLQRSESPGTSHISLSGATLAEKLPEVLRIYGEIVCNPALPEEQFEATREGALQYLYSLEDEPRQKIFSELRRRCLESPWGLPNEGTIESVQQLKYESVIQLYQKNFRPNGTILGIAGNVDFDEIKQVVVEVFGEWQPKEESSVTTGERGLKWDHLSHESTQTHIGIAYDSIPYHDPAYYEAWAAVSILSGGMSSRLFTEVREKRGLCYSIHASLSSLKDQARVLCYAGSTTERAQETLDVTIQEIQKLGEGISPEELERCKARAKSSLVMSQESSFSRSTSIARDWYHLGRITTLDEVRKKIDALTVPAVLDFVNAHPAEDFTILTIGPQELEKHS